MITRSKKRPHDIFVEYKAPRRKRKSSPIFTENIVDRNLELTDPTPNIHHLFKSLDARCFAGLLSENHVEVKWSKSMCLYDAGNCGSYRTEGNRDEIIINLNERLLKFRTRRDLVETLLHEMIHAALIINVTDVGQEHGPNFRKEMDRINAETGANISIYHNYSNEIALYEKRLWRCNGKCRNQPPKFGIIRLKEKEKDFVNFKDQLWWSYHLKNCGGYFRLVLVKS